MNEYRLTPAERDILSLLVDGQLTTREIAELRGRSVQTVKNQLLTIRRALGVHNTQQACEFFRRARVNWPEAENGGAEA